MKKLYITFLALYFIIFIASCKHKEIDLVDSKSDTINYKQEMRNLVISISVDAKDHNENFIIIPQNGEELITEDGKSTSKLDKNYISAIDGIGREDLFYGYHEDDEKTPLSETERMLTYLTLYKNEGLSVLTIDYCTTKSHIERTLSETSKLGFTPYIALSRNLEIIPNPFSVDIHFNNDDITKLSDAKNFLYLINPEKYATKADFIQSLSKTDYDLIVLDAYFNDEIYTPDEIAQLKYKSSGGNRLVIAYMSIGEAEEYRPYWKNQWSTNKPTWLDDENENWEGNYKVKYWMKGWQDILLDSKEGYLKVILDSEFDGVYLDLIDAFQYYENN